MYQIRKFKKLLGIKHFISTLSDGNMSYKYGSSVEVSKNRNIFIKKCGLNQKKIAYLHSTEVANNISVVDTTSQNLGIVEPYGFVADSIITSDHNIVIMLITADCTPVFIYDEKEKIIALAHCGVKWTDNGTLNNAITKLIKEFNSNPKNIYIGMGPSIHKKSLIYEYWNPTNKHFWKDCVEYKDGKYMIDNKKANLNQLFSVGIPKANIFISKYDTYTSSKFYSHTRSRNTDEKEGRFANLFTLN